MLRLLVLSPPVLTAAARRRPRPRPAAGLDPYNADTALDCATDIVSFTGSFHGRTMGSLALTYKAGHFWEGKSHLKHMCVGSCLAAWKPPLFSVV